MRALRALFPLLAVAAIAPAAPAQQFKVEPLKEAPPEDISPEIREILRAEGYRVLDDNGDPYVDVWLRKAVPTTGEPGGPQEAIVYPFLETGQLLGAMRFPGDGFDYRDQLILPGAYTMRYGLQPVDGDHLGVSTYRDYALLVPAEYDRETAVMAREDLEFDSAEASGTNHPAIFMMLPPPESGQVPATTRDEDKDLHGVVLPMPLAVEGKSEPTTRPFQLIVLGAAPI